MADKMLNYKEYARQMRENRVTNEQGNIVCSPELWERIAGIIEQAILPPCKVGDTVYYISFGKVYKGECHAITLKPTMQIHLYDYDGDNASLKADRVFLTREEAEKALREKEK